MISAVDTNVLLDILIPDEPHREWSERNLAQAGQAGALIISEMVYAELSVRFTERVSLDSFLANGGIRLVPAQAAALYRAGRAWHEYLQRRPTDLRCPQCGASQAVTCQQCGARIQSRRHLLADFLIAAHALVHADQLLTRDTGYYRTYFPELVVAGAT